MFHQEKNIARYISDCDCARLVRGLPRVTPNAALLQHLPQNLPNATPALLSPFIIRRIHTAGTYTMSDLPTIRIGYVPGTSSPL